MPLVETLAENARWIWAAGVAGPNHYVEFSREIDVRGDLAEAWLQLSAETSLRLWVNGRLIHSGPPREVPPYFYFDTIDLRPHLVGGRNEVRIVAHHQGKNSQSYQAGTPAFLVAGSCASADGTTVDFAETGGWRARRMTRYRQDAHRLFGCLGFSERVDFAAADLPWGDVSTVAMHPWAERPTALGRDLPAWRESVLRPVAQESHDGGWLIDMGMEVSGYIELDVQAEQPVTLVVSYAEALIDGRVDATKAGMNYSDRLELSAGGASWRSYEKRAFRFLFLDQAVDVRGVRVIEHSWPYEPVWRKAGGSELVRRIREVSARTIELNSEDLLTDCPWRERAQYLDCQHYMGAMQKLFGTLEPIRRFLHQFPRGADATGLLRMCYPSPAGMTVIPDFSMSYAVLLLRYLELSGDLETVRKNLPLAERGVLAFRQYEDAAGLLTDVPGWIFLDNTFELPKFPRSAGLNAVYHGGYRSLAALLRACGEPARAEEMDARAAVIRAVFRTVFLRDGRLLDADSTPEHERHRQWVYHHGPGKGGSFRLQAEFKKSEATHPLRLAVHGGARVWIDGVEVAVIKEGGSWTRSAIYQPVTLPTPADTAWHRLELEVEFSGIDWECYLSSLSDVEWREAHVADRPVELRASPWPWLTQTTVGYAAYHGLLEDDEAKVLLKACLPARYVLPYAKRTTPFFAHIGEAAAGEKRILPCNVPASLFHFCHALRRYGMEREARELLLPIYSGMLERGATTWWEEWNTGSSLCHAWASFVVEFLEE
ncbi:MAG: hypothetical protein ACAH89_14975 [Rariglobus sp.]|nr:hypothetical protein [Rariglobus sp.]